METVVCANSDCTTPVILSYETEIDPSIRPFLKKLYRRYTKTFRLNSNNIIIILYE